MRNLTEEGRLRALRNFQILDTPPDGTYNKMTALAAKVFNVPIAIISLVDNDRIWFKSHYGIQIEQVDREPGLCSSAILSDDLYLVEDAKSDPRTLANPLVAGEFGLQFYAAAPLKTKEGYNLGTFCIIDTKKRSFSTEHQEMLLMMGEIVMDEMELRMEARKVAEDFARN